MFTNFMDFDHAGKIFSYFYSESPPYTTRTRWSSDQPLQITSLSKLWRSPNVEVDEIYVLTDTKSDADYSAPSDESVSE